LINNLSFGLSSSKSEKFTPQILGFFDEVNGQRPFTSQKSTRDASKLPEFEEEKTKTQVRMQEIKIPTLGESITEATIGNLLKPSGSLVREGEEIIELETEKVNQVLYSPASGVIQWKVTGGEVLPIGSLIGTLEEKEVPQEKEGEKVAVAPSPAVEIKKEREEKKPTETLRETRRPMSKIRQTIASRMVTSLRESAMLTTFNEVDMSAIIELRTTQKDSFQKKYGVKLGFMSFFVKAVVQGLKDFPDLNSYIDQAEIVHREYYDIGVAVGTEKGVVVPVIRHADQRTFSEIEKEIEVFADKARKGGLAIGDLQGGSFTITNGGIYGSLLSTPIINPPQAGILGMHKIIKRPIAIEDRVVIRPMMYLALSYDHRIIDGKEAVSFLVRVKEVLEDPSRLSID